MTERERCPVCDFPLASESDCRAPFSTDLPSLCWKRFNGDHRGPAIDWRARALKAEADAARLREALEGLLDHGCLCAVNDREEPCQQCAAARAALAETPLEAALKEEAERG